MGAYSPVENTDLEIPFLVVAQNHPFHDVLLNCQAVQSRSAQMESTPGLICLCSYVDKFLSSFCVLVVVRSVLISTEAFSQELQNLVDE